MKFAIEIFVWMTMDDDDDDVVCFFVCVPLSVQIISIYWTRWKATHYSNNYKYKLLTAEEEGERFDVEPFLLFVDKLTVMMTTIPNGNNAHELKLCETFGRCLRVKKDALLTAVHVCKFQLLGSLERKKTFVFLKYQESFGRCTESVLKNPMIDLHLNKVVMNKEES